MSVVTVPDRGEGIRPRGPSTRPRGPTTPIMSGVARATSKSIVPPLICWARSSAPTMSAPAARAFSAFSPWAKTATRTLLPMPWGNATDPRTFWSLWRGSIPRWVETSTVWLNLVVPKVLRILTASARGTGPAALTFSRNAR